MKTEPVYYVIAAFVLTLIVVSVWFEQPVIIAHSVKIISIDVDDEYEKTLQDEGTFCKPAKVQIAGQYMTCSGE